MMPRLPRAALEALVLAALVLFAEPGWPQGSPARPPNVVLVLADDLGWGDVGFNGRRTWTTPHLDRLAQQGTVFRRWYAAAVVCAPSRAALLTGKYGIHNGVSGNADDLPREAVTLAEALGARGYRTALFGKWHHGAPRPDETSYVHPMDHGFDEFFGFTDAKRAWEQFPKSLWFDREERPVDGYANTLFTDRAIRFLEANRDRPFFLYVPYTATHFHIQAPEEDVRRFRGRFREQDAADPLNATYAAMVTRLDAEIGRLLSALDRLRLSGNTIVIFSSDHGATFERGNRGTSAFHDSNRPFRGQKRTLWEGGIRVPGVVRWPGVVPAGKVSDEIAHMIDLFPTLLGAAGGQVDPAWNIDGIDLRDVWRERTRGPARTLFWEWRSEGHDQRAAMRGSMKLVVSGGNPPELFDVVRDPGERMDLSGEHVQLARQLQAALAAWLETETPASRWGKTR
jgi:arylsulfatase A